MASFIPNHLKKKESLIRKENALRHLVESGASSEKLRSAALKVRDGGIAVLRAKQNQNPERTAAERAVFLRDEEKIRRLRGLTAEAILIEFLSDPISN